MLQRALNEKEMLFRARFNGMKRGIFRAIGELLVDHLERVSAKSRTQIDDRVVAFLRLAIDLVDPDEVPPGGLPPIRVPGFPLPDENRPKGG